MDSAGGLQDPGQPQVHRAHGLRPPPHHQHPLHPRRPAFDQWLWTPEPVHRAIITRQTWDTYVLRSRVRCRACKRRMYGATRATATGETVTYYLCPHSPANPRHAAQVPDHPAPCWPARTSSWSPSATASTSASSGPDRAARKDAEAARLRKRVKMIDAFEDAHTGELEALIRPAPPATPSPPCAPATSPGSPSWKPSAPRQPGHHPRHHHHQRTPRRPGHHRRPRHRPDSRPARRFGLTDPTYRPDDPNWSRAETFRRGALTPA